MRPLILCLLSVMSAISGFAQSPADSSPSVPAAPATSSVPLLHSTSRNVILDIVVTDASGRPVRDLKESDFVLKEDKQLQAIHLTSSPSSGVPDRSNIQLDRDAAIASEAGETLTGASGAEHARIRNVILLDEMNVRFLDLAFARQRLAAFFESAAARDQEFALMAMTTTQVILVHDFTTDKSALVDSVRRLPAVLPASAADNYVDQEKALEDLRRSVGVLETIAHALSGSSGHVNLFWITSGFPTLSLIGSSGEIQFTFDELMRHASNLYLNARMTVYTIDSHGVEWIDSLPDHTQPGSASRPGGNGFLRGGGGGVSDGDQFAAQMDHMTSMQAVANDLLGNMDARTGGRAFSNQNNIDAQLTEALHDGDSVYTVAYSPTDKNFDGAFRRISVRVNRPGLYARTREGYYALASGVDASPALRRAQLASALDSPLPYRGLRVSGQLSTENKRLMLRVHVSAPDVEWSNDPAGVHVAQTIAVATYSKSNHPIGSRQWQVTVSRPGRDDARDLVYALPFDVAAGTARLRLVVADNGGIRMGTTDVPLTSENSTGDRATR